MGYSDASFANNYDLTSQLGHIVFVTDGEGNAAPIHLKSYKARLVTRSVMAADVIPFSDAFDVGYTLATELSSLPRKKVILILLTNSKSLFDVISKVPGPRRRG